MLPPTVVMVEEISGTVSVAPMLGLVIRGTAYPRFGRYENRTGISHTAEGTAVLPATLLFNIHVVELNGIELVVLRFALVKPVR